MYSYLVCSNKTNGTVLGTPYYHGLASGTPAAGRNGQELADGPGTGGVEEGTEAGESTGSYSWYAQKTRGGK